MRPPKRDVVLDTAERLFYEEGFHATGIDRVVAEAGVARMTLYNHFPSKEALIKAVLARRHERYLDELRRAVEARGDAPALAALVEAHYEWLRTASPHGCIVLKAMGEFECHGPAIAALGRRLKHDLLALIRETLAQDGEPANDDRAESVLLVLEGANALVPVLGWHDAVQRARGLIAGSHDVVHA